MKKLFIEDLNIESGILPDQLLNVCQTIEKEYKEWNDQMNNIDPYPDTRETFNFINWCESQTEISRLKYTTSSVPLTMFRFKIMIQGGK